MQRLISEEVAGLPPSSKLVYLVLNEGGEPLSQKQVAEESVLPSRTVRYALNRLIDEGVVERNSRRRDRRELVYRLTDDGVQ